MSEGLSEATVPELEALLSAVRTGRLSCPLSAVGMSAAGFRDMVWVAERLRGLDGAAVEAVLGVALAERDRPVPHVDLVWTGPDSRGSASRSTAVVVKELFASARKSVLLAGYSFDHGKDILRPLHEAMVERSVAVTAFVDVKRGRRQDDADAHAQISIDQLLHRNWPFGEPYPEVYYDPRTAEADAIASLHAKCIVVDERRSLVTSANFTDRGQSRNIEVGALIEDANFSGKLVAQWFGLVSGGKVRRYA